MIYDVVVDGIVHMSFTILEDAMNAARMFVRDSPSSEIIVVDEMFKEYFVDSNTLDKRKKTRNENVLAAYQNLIKVWNETPHNSGQNQRILAYCIQLARLNPEDGQEFPEEMIQ